MRLVVSMMYDKLVFSAIEDVNLRTCACLKYATL